MEINEKILEIFEEFDIPKDDGLCYLISLHFGLNPSFIPDLLKKKVNSSQIAEADEDGSLKWNAELFKSKNMNTPFDWVKTEYVKLFSERNPEKGGNIKESTNRMKAFFAKNPEVRKDDVLDATRLYLSRTDPAYIRLPHYFIEKGAGAAKISDLESWLERLKEEKEQVAMRSRNLTNTLQ